MVTKPNVKPSPTNQFTILLSSSRLSRSSTKASKAYIALEFHLALLILGNVLKVVKGNILCS